MNDRDDLLRVIKDKAVVHGDFVLSSGQRATWYIDLRRVLAVEDTSTTGASVLTAVDALQEAGADVVGVAVLVERGARDRVTQRGLPFRAAYDAGDLGLG